MSQWKLGGVYPGIYAEEHTHHESSLTAKMVIALLSQIAPPSGDSIKFAKPVGFTNRTTYTLNFCGEMTL